MGIIYCATNKISGKKYVGLSTVSLKARKYSHERIAKSRQFKSMVKTREHLDKIAATKAANKKKKQDGHS